MEKKLPKKNRKEFLKISKEYFDKHGLELTQENGNKIPKDTTVHDLGLEEGWSIDVYILTTEGIRKAYYRGKNPNFTVEDFLFDKYIKDIDLISNNFLYSIDDLIP